MPSSTNLSANPAFSTQNLSTPAQSPSMWSQIGSFMNSPTGQMIQAGVPIATGMYGAQQAQQNIQNLTNQLRGVAAPNVQYGQNVLQQLQGGAPVSGPAGQLIGSQLQGAQQLSQAALPYASGQLTPGQSLALQQAAQGASARTNLAFNMAGGQALSSAGVASQQAIADQSVIAAGQIQQQNIQFAQQAMQSAQSVYNGILQQSLSSAQLGISAYAPAMTAQINADQQISQQMQQLISGVASGVTGANPSGPGGTSAAQNFGNTIRNWLQSGNQSGSVNQPSATQQTTGPSDSGMSSNYSVFNMPQFSTQTMQNTFSDTSGASSSGDGSTSSGDGGGPP
jgi:hypothetical protein